MTKDFHHVYLQQLQLHEEGLYGGKLDGLWGPNTQRAYEEFKDLNPVPEKKKTDRVSVEVVEPPAIKIEYRDNLRSVGRHTPKRIILHHTCGYFESSIQYLASVGYAYHFMIDFDGKIVRLVPPDMLCYHAKNHNTGSVGIAFNGDTVSGQYRHQKDLNELELNSAVELIKELKRQYGDLDIVTHQEVDPKRKNDTSQEVKKQILDRL